MPRIVVTGKKDQPPQLSPAPYREGKRDKRSPGVSNDNGPLDIEPIQRAMHEMGLC